MRFMISVNATANSEAGVDPAPEIYETMGKFNQELVNTGALLVAEGLEPSAKGARIVTKDGRITVVDGPFAETKELIAGFWLIQCKSKEEAIEWARRIPNPFNEDMHADVRQVAGD
jgi:hypothetical protein